MTTSYAHQARTVIRRAADEARRAGSRTIEAEHVLLALADPEGLEAHEVLAAAGLDQEAIRAALRREVQRSLAAAGVVAPAGGPPHSSRTEGGRLRIGASTKAALHRAMLAAKPARQLTAGHMLIGVLGADAGTVPRALGLAGVDPRDLADRARRSVAGGEPS